MNLDHCTRMDCSLTLSFDANKLMVPWPDEENRVFASIRPFQSQVCHFNFPEIYFFKETTPFGNSKLYILKVWTMLLISVIAVSLMIAYLQKFNQSNNNHDGEQVNMVRNHGINYHAALIYVLNGEGKYFKPFLQDYISNV